MAKIAVEEQLSNIMQALENNGHQVVTLNESTIQDCEYCVISGQDRNMMGITEMATQGSVIDASGLTAEQIVQQVNQGM